MVECIVCKKPNAQITIEGHALIRICGEPDCKDKKGRTLGEWLLDDTDNGNYFYIENLKTFKITIDRKTHNIINDKRIIRGLSNKIQELKK